MRAGPIGKASLAYWAVIFAIGFVLGTVRVLVLVDAIGLLAATLVELPFIVGVSWLVARWLVRRFAIHDASEALVMGGLAVVLLLASELALTAALPGDNPAQWLSSMAQLPGAIGLAGQVVFGLMPWIVVRARCGI